MTNPISDELRKAEKHIKIALEMLGALDPGGNKVWPGAWCEHKKLAGLLLKTHNLLAGIEHKEIWLKNCRGE